MEAGGVEMLIQKLEKFFYRVNVFTDTSVCLIKLMHYNVHTQQLWKSHRNLSVNTV